MKIRSTVLVLMALAAWPALAANEEMRKLDWLIGEWKGEATVQMGPGKPETALQHEKVQSKAGGKVLLIEGVGRQKLEDGSAGEIVHDAMALISWDEAKKTYRFSTFVANRPDADATLEVTGPNSASWGFQTPQGHVRFTISKTEKGEWLEIGEYSRDAVKWTKFMDMKLQKVK